VEASSGSPVAHINERMIADALIEAELVTGSRLVFTNHRFGFGVWKSCGFCIAFQRSSGGGSFRELQTTFSPGFWHGGSKQKLTS
jgi:hypothetical protein